MPRETVNLLKFNAGKLSTQGLARVDLDRTRFSAETQTNYIPKVLGPMILRPGLGYIGSTYLNRKAFHIPFVAATDDTALIEITDMNLRVRVNDTVIARPSVSTAFSNGTFDTNLTGWTDADQSGTTSQWVTGGYMGLTGTGFNKAMRLQTLTVSASDQNIEHGMRIVITRGKAHIRVGSSSGLDDYISDTELLPGTHSFSFTPISGSVYVELASYTKYQTLIDSVSIEASGDMVIPTIWPEASLFSIRSAQSIDVVFCACYGYRPQRIERHGVRSWSVVDYTTEDGPYLTQNTAATTLAASAISGDITLTASQSYFRRTNIGSLFSITSIGQTVSASLNGDGQYTNFIRVVGTGSSRTFSITTTGTWVGTLTVQRSFTDTSSPANTTTTMTTNTTINFTDGLDNEIVYYRIGFNTGGWTSGAVNVTIIYSSGGLTGVVRITGFTTSTSVTASVLTDLGGTSATTNWSEGLWSDRRGYPSAVSLYEGRLWWGGKGTIVASISDAYDSFDPDTEGDSGPINRSIGEGPVDKINYIIPLQRLIVGGQGSEFSIRSSAFDEIITPDNFNIKVVSTQGSENVAAVKMDNSGIFAQQGGTRIFESVYNSDIFDYEVQELTVLVPEQCQSVVTKMVIQRKPDTRIHCILGDGTVAMMVYSKPEQVNAWIDITTTGADGFIEDVVVLPNTIEDTVYYVVKRTINGSTVRYLEKWAQESECVGGDLNKQADSFIVYDGTPTTTITGLSTLEGASVVVWADGMSVGTHTVSSGQITLSTAASKVVVGLSYTAQFKSVKLAYAAEGGTALNMHKRIPEIGLILSNTHRYGIKYGGDFDHLNDLPADYHGRFLGDDEIVAQYDDQQFSFNGDWDTDSRVCLQSEAPKPAMILGITMTVETNG